MGFDFYVNENVLIPRMDTEILVSEAIKRARIMFSQRQHDVNFRILDMCTGSGCIAQSTYLLLKNEGCTVEVDAVDISEKALEVARINASRLGAQVKLIRGNLFENVDNKYSMILSNPPYIRTDVIADLEPEVREHEPMLALDGTADGLYFYREITDKAWEYLENNGILMYEIGYDQALEVSDMLRQKGYTDIAVIKDFAGLDRVVAAKRP
jgi:release factor glutamine methyltransferase